MSGMVWYTIKNIKIKAIACVKEGKSMKSLRYMLALLLAVVACWVGDFFRTWTAVQTYMVSRVDAYALKVLIVALLVVAIGACCGVDFRFSGQHRGLLVAAFVVFLLLQAGMPIYGRLLENNFISMLMNAMAKTPLILYLLAFLTGLSFGSRREN